MSAQNRGSGLLMAPVIANAGDGATVVRAKREAQINKERTNMGTSSNDADRNGAAFNEEVSTKVER